MLCVMKLKSCGTKPVEVTAIWNVLGWQSRSCRMQDFLRLLKAHADASSPPSDLVTMAGKLCLDLEDNPVQVVQLVEAILDSKHRWALLKNIDVTLVCVQVLIQQEQHLLALQILEVCWRYGGGYQEKWGHDSFHCPPR